MTVVVAWYSGFPTTRIDKYIITDRRKIKYHNVGKIPKSNKKNR